MAGSCIIFSILRSLLNGIKVDKLFEIRPSSQRILWATNLSKCVPFKLIVTLVLMGHVLICYIMTIFI